MRPFWTRTVLAALALYLLVTGVLVRVPLSPTDRYFLDEMRVAFAQQPGETLLAALAVFAAVVGPFLFGALVLLALARVAFGRVRVAP